VARLAERGYRVTEVDLLPFIMSEGADNAYVYLMYQVIPRRKESI
jgi:hypothetical protein